MSNIKAAEAKDLFFVEHDDHDILLLELQNRSQRDFNIAYTLALSGIRFTRNQFCKLFLDGQHTGFTHEVALSGVVRFFKSGREEMRFTAYIAEESTAVQIAEPGEHTIRDHGATVRENVEALNLTREMFEKLEAIGVVTMHDQERFSFLVRRKKAKAEAPKE